MLEKKYHSVNNNNKRNSISEGSSFPSKTERLSAANKGFQISRKDTSKCKFNFLDQNNTKSKYINARKLIIHSWSFFKQYIKTSKKCWCKIYQTRNTVFHAISHFEVVSEAASRNMEPCCSMGLFCGGDVLIFECLLIVKFHWRLLFIQVNRS